MKNLHSYKKQKTNRRQKAKPQHLNQQIKNHPKSICQSINEPRQTKRRGIQWATCLTVIFVVITLSACHNVRRSVQIEQPPSHTHSMTHNSFEETKRLAQEGRAAAQYDLGYRYYYGIGVNSSMKRAKSWFFRAATKGNAQARQALRDIKKWQGDMREEDPAIVYHTPRPAYLPPPPTNRHRFADELASDE